jgi:hypothetical protein
LAEHDERRFDDEPTWMRPLERLGLTELAVSPDPVKIASEGGVSGGVEAHRLLPARR